MASEDYFARLSPPQGPGIFVQPAAAPAMPRLDTGAAAVAEALVGAGKVVEDIGVKWANATDHIGANLALTDFAQKANALEHGSSQDPNYFIAPDKLKVGLEDAKRQALEMVRDPVRRSDLDRVLSGRIIQSVNHASNAARSRAIEGARGAEDALDQDMLARWVKNQGDPVAQASIVGERFNGINESVKNGIYSAQAGEERKRKLNHETSAAQVMYATRVDPKGTAERLKDPNNYPGLTPTQREVAINNATGVYQQSVMDDLRVQAERNDPVVRGIVETTTRPQEAEGLTTPGNMNLLERPIITDPATGRPATVKSMNFEQDGKHILVPLVDAATGKVQTPEQAIAQYNKPVAEGGGRHLGIFDSAESATKYGERLSKEQALLTDTPQGRALMSLPPHMRFRTLESSKTALNQADTAAKQDADRMAAFQRDTNNIVQVIKDGGDVSDEVVTTHYRIQAAACARGSGPACKYVDELNSVIALAPHIKTAWQMDTATLGIATAQLRGTLTAAGANPDNAQFKALRAFESVLQEQQRILKEEPVAIGPKTRAFELGGVDLAAAAAGDPAALQALAIRGRQSEDVRGKYGGTGSPWLQTDLPRLKEQWATADAAGKYRILAALRQTMPSVETYTGAVTAIGGDSFSTANMRNIIRRDPELAKQVVRGTVILATDKDAAEKGQAIRSELLTYVGGDVYQPEQRRQAIELALGLDAARREAAGKLYDPNATDGLRKAWDDVNGPIEMINGRRTPIMPAITPGHFAGALQRLDERDVLRMGGAYDRSGRPITAQELSDNAVLVPTEPGSSLYYVGQKRPTTESRDGFGQFFDIEGRPLMVDMGYLTARHPVQPGIFSTTPARPPATPGERTIQRFSDFDQAVLADLRTQFPNESDAQLQTRLESINRSMVTPRFYPDVPGLRGDVFEASVAEGRGGFGFEPTGGFIDLREGAKKNELSRRERGVLERLIGPAPPAARAFATTVMGDRSKIDASFFTSEELGVLRDVAERALAKGEKVIGYGDYAPGGEQAYRDPRTGGLPGGTQSTMAALTDLPSSLSFTLGMARVRKERDGTIVITDKYDFAASPEKVEELKSKGTWAILDTAMRGLVFNGLLGPLNVIGNLATPEGKGRDVEIRIPPERK